MMENYENDSHNQGRTAWCGQPVKISHYKVTRLKNKHQKESDIAYHNFGRGETKHTVALPMNLMLINPKTKPTIFHDV